MSLWVVYTAKGGKPVELGRVRAPHYAAARKRGMDKYGLSYRMCGVRQVNPPKPEPIPEDAKRVLRAMNETMHARLAHAEEE